METGKGDAVGAEVGVGGVTVGNGSTEIINEYFYDIWFALLSVNVTVIVNVPVFVNPGEIVNVYGD